MAESRDLDWSSVVKIESSSVVEPSFATNDLAESPSYRRQASRFLPTIQFGRGIAALLVLFYHVSVAVFADNPRYIFHGGAAGVDIFFVISGFIITYVSRGDTARRFILKRVVRIVPLYYFYTTLVVAILLIKPALYANLRFKWSFVIASYSFILSPSNTGAPGVAVGVGWTLAYEAYFYVLMAIGIWLLGRRGWLFAALAVLIGAIASPFVTSPAPLMPMLTPLPLEFLAGVILAQLYVGGWRLGPGLAMGAIVVGMAAIIYAGMLDVVDGEFSNTVRIVWYGIPAAAIVAGLLSLHNHFPAGRTLLWIGDISYSLYLCHAFVIAAVMKIVVRLVLPPLAAIILLIAATLVVSLLSYRLIEVPSTRFFSWLFGVRNPQPAAREASAS